MKTELNDLPFVKLLTQTIQDQRLSRSELCVMSALVSKAHYDDGNKHVIATISAAELQAYIKTACLRTIKRCIQHLSEYGYIQVIRTKGQTNQYKILVDTGAKEDKPIQQPKKKTYNKNNHLNHPNDTQDYVEFQQKWQHEFVFGKGEGGGGDN